jgi:TolB-like protein
LADLLTENISVGLSQVDGMGVVSGASVQKLANADPETAGRELGVTAVLTTKLRVVANRVRVTPQLIDVATGRTIWQDQWNGELVVRGEVRDPWGFIDSIAVQIAATLRPEMASGAYRAARGPRTRDPEALRLYMAAYRELDTFTPEGHENARSLLQQAVGRDPRFADAWVALADLATFGSQSFGLHPQEAAASALRDVERAIDLDSTNAAAFATRAYIRRQYLRDWLLAESDMRRAALLAPSSAGIANGLSQWSDVPDTALAHARRAVALDPASSHHWSQLSFAYASAGIADSALQASERALQVDPDNWTAYEYYAHLLLSAGRRREADSIAAKLVQKARDWPAGLGMAANYYRRIGDRNRAAVILDRLNGLARVRYVSPSVIAAARLATGDTSGSLDALELAVKERDFIVEGAMQFWLHPLAGHPRFEAVNRALRGNRPLQPTPFRE